MKSTNLALIRFFDILLSTIGIIFLTIPIVIISAGIFIEDRGSIFFKQKRVGKNTERFILFKFRSMYENPSEFQGDVEQNNTHDIKKLRNEFKTTSANDNRITKIGKFIRSTHLDELPQLINVLSGDMSMVGVRPDTPVQQIDYPDEYWVERHKMRPGITGLAQLYARTMDERTALEKTWLHSPSVLLYFKVIILTFGKVLKHNSN